MNDYPSEPTIDVGYESEPDPRIVAVHRVVELEQQYERAARESEQRQKMAAIAKEELREARDVLSGLLGYPSNASGDEAIDGAEIRKAMQERRR